MENKQNILVNILLDIRHAHNAPTPRGPNNLGHQLRMRNTLPTLHDAHNGGLRLKLSVRGHALVRVLVLFFCLFELDAVNFHAVFGVGEGGVESEGVGGVDVTAFGVLCEGAEFGAGEGLEGAD